MVITLRKYQKKGIRTPYGIIKRWTHGNTESQKKIYTAFIAKGMSCDTHTKLHLSNPVVLEKLVRLLIRYEEGYNPYPEEMYRTVFPYNKELK